MSQLLRKIRDRQAYKRTMKLTNRAFHLMPNLPHQHQMKTLNMLMHTIEMMYKQSLLICLRCLEKPEHLGKNELSLAIDGYQPSLFVLF